MGRGDPKCLARPGCPRNPREERGGKPSLLGFSSCDAGSSSSCSSSCSSRRSSCGRADEGPGVRRGGGAAGVGVPADRDHAAQRGHSQRVRPARSTRGTAGTTAARSRSTTACPAARTTSSVSSRTPTASTATPTATSRPTPTSASTSSGAAATTSSTSSSSRSACSSRSTSTRRCWRPSSPTPSSRACGSTTTRSTRASAVRRPRWVGVCLAAFGIVYNPDLYRTLGLPARRPPGTT